MRCLDHAHFGVCFISVVLAADMYLKLLDNVVSGVSSLASGVPGCILT